MTLQRRLLLLSSLFLYSFILSGVASARLTPTKLEFAEDPAKLPLISNNDRLFVTVTIDSQDYRFLYDTGALTVLTASIAGRHSFDTNDRIRITDSSNKKQKMGFCNIPELQLGELTVSNLPATIFPDDNSIFECLAIDGILGSNAFARTTVKIDTKEGLLTVYKTHPEDLQNQLKLDNQNGPYLVTTLGDSELTFFFDSGSTSYGKISKRSYKKSRQSFSEIAVIRGIRSWGVHGFAKPERFSLLETNKLQFSNTTIPRYPLILGKENTLGSPLLRHGVLTLDYENRRWGFQPSNPIPETSINRVSIMPLPTDDGWQVGSLDQSIKGIRVGDEVVTIEGIDLSELSICDLIVGDLKQLISNKKITIRTKKGDIERIIYPLSDLHQ